MKQRKLAQIIKSALKRTKQTMEYLIRDKPSPFDSDYLVLTYKEEQVELPSMELMSG